MDREFHGLIGPLQQFTVRRNGKSRSGKADFKNNDDPFFNINTKEDLENAKKLLKND